MAILNLDEMLDMVEVGQEETVFLFEVSCYQPYKENAVKLRLDAHIPVTEVTVSKHRTDSLFYLNARDQKRNLVSVNRNRTKFAFTREEAEEEYNREIDKLIEDLRRKQNEVNEAIENAINKCESYKL